MTASPIVFDRRLFQNRRDRAARTTGEFDFLFLEAAERLVDRLRDLRRDFDTVVDLGARNGILTDLWPETPRCAALIHTDLSTVMALQASKRGPAVACDEEALPFAASSLDAVLSCLSMHWINDLPGTLVQIRRALRPDGLLMASLLGGTTLSELRDVLTLAEHEITGGVSPHVSPFANLPDLGGLLQRAGFALPVVDSACLTVTYADMFRLIADLRGMGETNVLTARRKEPLRRSVIMRAAELYQERFAGPNGRIPATFEILTMTGWAPDPSQQQPLRPGSAQARLSDALGTVESGAGENPRPARGVRS